MHQHHQPADVHTDTPDLGAALRQALFAAIARSRLTGLVDLPAEHQPRSARVAGGPPRKRHSWLHTASHAAVYAAAGLHLLHRRSHRGH
jgi:hypothetical protein